MEYQHAYDFENIVNYAEKIMRKINALQTNTMRFVLMKYICKKFS